MDSWGTPLVSSLQVGAMFLLIWIRQLSQFSIHLISSLSFSIALWWHDTLGHSLFCYHCWFVSFPGAELKSNLVTANNLQEGNAVLKSAKLPKYIQHHASVVLCMPQRAGKKQWSLENILIYGEIHGGYVSYYLHFNLKWGIRENKRGDSSSF